MYKVGDIVCADYMSNGIPYFLYDDALSPHSIYPTNSNTYISLFRKAGIESPVLNPDSSNIFIEERDKWYKGVWGTNTNTPGIFNIYHRLIHMFSYEYDYVLDPYAGIGQTARAAIIAKRNSVSVEISQKKALCLF